MSAHTMRLWLLSSGLLFSLALAAQYPSNPAKSRLGYQTTGDGLIFRGSGAPAYSPGTLFNAWTYLDTTNMILYGYKNFSWVRLPSANNGLTMSGAYAQLGGSLNQNTTVESGTYNLKLGKTSGTNYAYINTYGSGEYAGMYSVFGAIETDFGIGGGAYNLTSNDADDTNLFSFAPTGFDFTYIGGSGVSRFRMDSTKFNMVGLDSYASHAAANAVELTNNLYMLNDSRHVYINSGTGSADILGSGTTDRSARWSATNTLAAGNMTDNGTKLQALLPFQLTQWTTAGRPTGVTGYEGYNTSGNGKEWYQGSRWAYALESTFARGTSTYIPFFDANGQLTESGNVSYSNSSTLFNLSNSKLRITKTVSVLTDTMLSIKGRFVAAANNTNAYGIVLQSSYTPGSFTGTGFYPLSILYADGSAAFSVQEAVVKVIYINSGGGGTRFGGNVQIAGGATASAAINQENSFGFRVQYNGQTMMRDDNTNAFVSGSAMLELVSTSKGFLPSRWTSANRTAISSPSTALIGYQTDGTEGLYVKQASAWKRLLWEGDATWLKTELEASRDVDITGGTSTDFRIRSNTRNQFDGKFKIGTDSSFVHDPSQDTTTMRGILRLDEPLGKYTSNQSRVIIRSGGDNTPWASRSGSMVVIGGNTRRDTSATKGLHDGTVIIGSDAYAEGGNNSYYHVVIGEAAYTKKNEPKNTIIGATSSALDADNVVIGYNNQNRKLRGISVGTNNTITADSAYVFGHFVTNNFAKSIAIGYAAATTEIGQVKIGSNVNTRINFHNYGAGNKEASDLSKTESVYNSIYATDGTLIEKRANTEQYNAITSTTSPVTLSSTIADNLINQGSTQATFTLNLPASPTDGQIVMITYNNAITTLTIDGNGNTIVGSAVTTAVAGSQRKFKFYTGIGWIKQY